MSNLAFKKVFHKQLHNGEYTVASLMNHTYVTEPDYDFVNDIHIPNATRSYLIGPIVERLADFEALGYEPTELRDILDICIEKGLINEKTLNNLE